MFPTSHPQIHHHLTTSNIHHQPRQSKLLDNQTYSQSQSPAPQPNRTRNQQPATKKGSASSCASSSTTATRGSSAANLITPTCANCGTQTTPLWRRNQSGETLCNACALFQKMKGRPRPISLKTNVIKPRNRIKAIDRIPLGPSSSINQQHPLCNNDTRANTLEILNRQVNHLTVNSKKNNQNYHPNNPNNIASAATITPTTFFPHCSQSNPISARLCSSALSSPNAFHSPTTNTHFFDPHHLSPSPNSLINVPSSQSPSPSQSSFCSSRSAPLLDSNPPYLIRSGVNGRKSFPGGTDPFCRQDSTKSITQDSKRRKRHLLPQLDIYERRTSAGSTEPPHQHHHLPLRASSGLARTTLTLPSRSDNAQPSDYKTSPSNDHSDQFPCNPLHSLLHDHASADDIPQPRPSQPMSCTHRALSSVDKSTVVEEMLERGVADAYFKGPSRRRSSLRSSRITLPPLSHITKDLVPAVRLNPSPISFGPPLSFEASAREAKLNSPNSSQNLLAIPSSLHQKKLDARRAVSVNSSVSDCESVISPAHTASTISRTHSPRDHPTFGFSNGSPTTPPVTREGFSKYFHAYPSDRDEAACRLQTRSEMDLVENPELSKWPADPSEPHLQEKKSPTELHRLKDRIAQLEFINGAMESRINELETNSSTHASKSCSSEASDDLHSSRSGDVDYGGVSPNDIGRWTEENESADEDEVDEMEGSYDESGSVEVDMEI